MAQILTLLKGAGLDRLPGEAQLMDEHISTERQFIIIRDERRFTYRLSAAKPNIETFKLFNACEKVLVDASHEKDDYVETRGIDSTPDFKPLHPNPSGQ